MSELATISCALQVRSDVAIRPATLADVPFMDGLQKAHSKQLGYFPTKQFEGYVAQGAVLVADGLGYVIAKDRYLKRDELGVVYQLCVAPGTQRKQVGAALVKAVFERSAYGCRLYCCWCAQDIEANRFWESMGFLPIAFRAGSEKKSRVHIFWQRRINADDQTTPYWFPSKTESGAIREDRLVFPIPPGTHWTEVKAVQLPQAQPALAEPPRKIKSGPQVGATCGPQKPTPSPRAHVQFGPPTATPIALLPQSAAAPASWIVPTAAP